MSVEQIIRTRNALETGFPGVYLSTVAEKESWRKEVHRPATSTHKWWAKRLGSVFRGIITAAVSDSEEEAIARYSAHTDLDGLVVLDPFGGSGVTAVEALKLGARAVSFDINPVATLVQRQAVQRWNPWALQDAYRRVEDMCREEIDRVHRTSDGRTVLYFFWVGLSRCTTCGVDVRLFDSPIFSRNAYPKRVPRAQIVCPTCLDVQEGVYDFTEAVCSNGHAISPRGAVSGSSMHCPNGHASRITDGLYGQPPRYEMFAKMVWNGPTGKTYEPIEDWDRELYEECAAQLENEQLDLVLPVGELEPGENTTQAMRWNFHEWRQFFNARQLYSLGMLARAIQRVPGEPVEREALSALFSGTLEFNNMFCSFKGEGTGAVRHMFAHHVLKPERTPLEAHPWGTPVSSGSFSTLMQSRLMRAHAYKTAPVDLVLTDGKVERVVGLGQPVETAIAHSASDFISNPGLRAYVATKNSATTDMPDDSVDLVVTDPPYMDNVHYSELADFFHAWLKVMNPFTGYKQADSTRASGEVQDADPERFEQAITAVWTECARVLKPDGLLAFTFHQARASGWTSLIRSLREAGFEITAVQPVKGEMSTSIVKSGSREPSNLDSVVVCRHATSAAVDGRSSLQALDAATRVLKELADGGVTVGIGDVRSVVRGSLLSALPLDGTSLEEHLEEIDAQADRVMDVLGLR